MAIGWIILMMLVFLLGYFTMDARHDTWMNLEMRNRVKAAGCKFPVDVEAYLTAAGKYASRWHMMDSIIKGYVIAFVTFAFIGLDWGIPILFFLAFAIRWFWFDLNWNWFAGKEPWYSGTTAKTDKIFKKKWFQIAGKVFLVLVAGALTFVYFKIYYV